MAQPFITWTQPLGTTANPSPGGSPIPISTTIPHILRNDLVTISRKAPENLKNVLIEKENYDKLPKDIEKVKNYILKRI